MHDPCDASGGSGYLDCAAPSIHYPSTRDLHAPRVHPSLTCAASAFDETVDCDTGAGRLAVSSCPQFFTQDVIQGEVLVAGEFSPRPGRIRHGMNLISTQLCMFRVLASPRHGTFSVANSGRAPLWLAAIVPPRGPWLTLSGKCRADLVHFDLIDRVVDLL